MSEKTYVFDGGSTNGIVSALAPMLQSKGIDPGVLALMNNNGGFGGNGGWWIWVIFLAMMWGGWGGRGGFGGYGDGTGFLASQLNNDYGRDVLLQAISGNSNAISQLASTLHCDVAQIQSTLCSLSNAVGLTGQQIINAVQSGDASIAAQIASCCCDVKQIIATQGFENRLATQEQTNILASKIDAQTNVINDKFCQLEMREMQSKIDALRDEKLALQNNISQRAQNEYIATSLFPITTALTELRADFDCFKSKLPETVTVRKDTGVYVPYSPYSVVPNCFASQFGVGPYCFNGNNSLWG